MDGYKNMFNSSDMDRLAREVFEGLPRLTNPSEEGRDQVQAEIESLKQVLNAAYLSHIDGDDRYQEAIAFTLLALIETIEKQPSP